MIHVSLFSGIGGFDIASEWIGWNNILSCEINEFCNTVLKYYWPNAYHHKDIHTLNYETINNELSRRLGRDWQEEKIILTGGFPCQPYSLAGKRKGKDDDRHLWPQMLRVIEIVRPDWIVGENVPGIINWSDGMVFNEVQTDLENQGYSVLPVILPACSVNAPHKRYRIWFIAHRTNSGCEHGSIYNGRGKEETRGREVSDEPCSTSKGGIITDSPINAISGQDRQDDGIEGERTSVNESVNGGQRETIQHEGLDDVSRNDTYTQGGIASSEYQRQGQGEFGRCFGKDDPNTIDKGLQRSKEERNITESWQERNKQLARSLRTNWKEFPTQPPLCGRNDGIPLKLGNIAFSKWRNESIKAYGNAIVPQVVYEIFKTIEEYENRKQT